MVRATKAAKFSTCQCPGLDQPGAGKGILARFGRKPSNVTDGNGKVVAVMCARCTLPIAVVCRACDKGTHDIDLHVKDSPKCGEDIAYKTSRATPGGGRSKKAPKTQAALFSDDVLRGPRREGMGGR